MIGGFDIIPRYKDCFNPKEYNPKWAVVVMGPVMLFANLFWDLGVRPYRKIRKALKS